MDKRVRLTLTAVDNAKPRSTDYFIWDKEVVGFGLRVRPGGHRSYVLQYRHAGRTRRYAIGGHGSPWTVQTARAEAQRLLGDVARDIDVQEEKVERRREITVAELCDLYLTVGLATRKPGAVAAARCDCENHIKPLLGSRRVSDIRRADVERLLINVANGVTARRAKTRKKRGVSRVRGGKGAANSSVQTLSAALGFAVRREFRADNPALGVRKFPERKIERFLSPAELARLGEVLAAAEALGVESPYAIAAIRLLALTGCRRNEILCLKRAHVDRRNKCLRLPDSKTGAKVVHVGAAVVAVIDALPEVSGNPYLLPGRNGVGHLADLQSCWERIRKAAGLADVRLHDLRHSFASVGAAAGDSLLVIGALLGHRSAKTTQRYAHLSDHPLKGAADRISEEIAAALGTRFEVSAAQAVNLADCPAREIEPVSSILGQIVQTKWLDTRAAARHLGLTVGTLQTYRWMGVGPGFQKIGRRVVYSLEALESWQSMPVA